MVPQLQPLKPPETRLYPIDVDARERYVTKMRQTGATPKPSDRKGQVRGAECLALCNEVLIASCKPNGLQERRRVNGYGAGEEREDGSPGVREEFNGPPARCLWYEEAHDVIHFVGAKDVGRFIPVPGRITKVHVDIEGAIAGTNYPNNCARELALGERV